MVAVTVFLIVIGTLIAGYLSAKRVVAKQKEMVWFDAVCQDIAKFGDVYGKSWDVKYFGDGAGSYIKQETIGGTADENGNITGGTICYTVYYSASYSPIAYAQADSARFCITYSYEANANGEEEMILSVQNTVSNYYIVEGLNYGSARYLDDGSSTQTNNTEDS